MPVAVQKDLILLIKIPTQSFRDASIREMGRRFASVFVSAFLGMGTSHLHFQNGGVDLWAQIAHRRSYTRCTVCVGHSDIRLYVTPLIPADDCRLLWWSS